VTLSDLLARVEAATGPDRELDDAIVELMFGKSMLVITEDAGTVWRNHKAPFYTASIDAALALAERVLPDHEIEMFQLFHGNGWGVNFRAKHIDTAYAPTPALALIAAILKALIAAENKEPT